MKAHTKLRRDASWLLPLLCGDAVAIPWGVSRLHAGVYDAANGEICLYKGSCPSILPIAMGALVVSTLAAIMARRKLSFARALCTQVALGASLCSWCSYGRPSILAWGYTAQSGVCDSWTGVCVVSDRGRMGIELSKQRWTADEGENTGSVWSWAQTDYRHDGTGMSSFDAWSSRLRMTPNPADDLTMWHINAPFWAVVLAALVPLVWSAVRWVGAFLSIRNAGVNDGGAPGGGAPKRGFEVITLTERAEPGRR